MPSYLDQLDFWLFGAQLVIIWISKYDIHLRTSVSRGFNSLRGRYCLGMNAPTDIIRAGASVHVKISNIGAPLLRDLVI